MVERQVRGPNAGAAKFMNGQDLRARVNIIVE
jgi:hypothetical protein